MKGQNTHSLGDGQQDGGELLGQCCLLILMSSVANENTHSESQSLHRLYRHGTILAQILTLATNIPLQRVVTILHYTQTAEFYIQFLLKH